MGKLFKSLILFEEQFNQINLFDWIFISFNLFELQSSQTNWSGNLSNLLILLLEQLILINPFLSKSILSILFEEQLKKLLALFK